MAVAAAVFEKVTPKRAIVYSYKTKNMFPRGNNHFFDIFGEYDDGFI